MPDDGIETLYGSLDENLKQLEQAFGVRISTGHSELIIEGDAGNAGRAERVVIFGITGDLAYKKIFPALQFLVRRLDLKTSDAFAGHELHAPLPPSPDRLDPRARAPVGRADDEEDAPPPPRGEKQGPTHGLAVQSRVRFHDAGDALLCCQPLED